jgi:uncharacterized membrane protein
VREFAYGSAWSALALGAFYLLLARTLWSRRGEGQRLLVEAFLALGVVFTTLAIPLAFDGRWTSAAWAIEGAAIVWVGVRQQRLPARLFGILLQLLAGFFYLHDLVYRAGDWPVLNSVYLGALLLALAGLFCAWLLQRRRQELHPAERWLARPAVCLGHRCGGLPAVCTRSIAMCATRCRATRRWPFSPSRACFQRLERACTGRRRATRRWPAAADGPAGARQHLP